MINNFNLKIIKGTVALVVIFTLCLSTAQAYSPPPASNWYILSRLRKPYISITLAPLLKPNALKFAGMDRDPKVSKGYSDGITVTWTPNNNSTTDPIDDYLTLKITGMKANDPANAQLQMTFEQPISSDKIKELKIYLQGNGNTHPQAHIGDSGCNKDDTIPIMGPFLCLKSDTKGFAPDVERTISLGSGLIQKIPLGGVYVEGNVAGGGNINNLFVNPDSIIVGGVIQDQAYANLKLEGYMETSELSEYNFVEKEKEVYSKAQSIGTLIEIEGITGLYHINGVINLNSNNKDLLNPNISTFSSPPEGKLWYIKAPDASGFKLYNMDISGSGTLVLEKGKQVIIGPGIRCAPGTRFAVIGSAFDFRIEAGMGSDGIECGAYMNLNSIDGKITFNSMDDGDVSAKLIAISAKDIIIQTNLKNPFFINYNTDFAKNPTVFFQELLDLNTNKTQ